MLAEFSLGRAGRSDAFGVFHKLSPRGKWWLIGALGILASYTIGCFYMVVTGWTFEYLFNSVTGDLYDGMVQVAAGGDFTNADIFFAEKMHQYISTPWPPIIFTWLVILINIAVLTGGGAERHRKAFKHPYAPAFCGIDSVVLSHAYTAGASADLNGS